MKKRPHTGPLSVHYILQDNCLRISFRFSLCGFRLLPLCYLELDIDAQGIDYHTFCVSDQYIRNFCSRNNCGPHFLVFGKFLKLKQVRKDRLIDISVFQFQNGGSACLPEPQ